MSAPARPTRVKRNESFAECASSRKSEASASTEPAPAATPLTAATIGSGAVAHRLHDRSAHAREVEKLAGAHLLELADDLLDVAAGAEAAAFAR